MGSSHVKAHAIALLLLLTACQGNIEASFDPQHSGPDQTPSPGEQGPMLKPGPMPTPDPAPAPVVLPGGPLPLRVLNRTEYIHTVKDVLGLDATELTSGFPSEITGDTGLPTVGTLSSLHIQRYQDAAEALASGALDAVRDQLPSCGQVVDAACASAMVEEFGPGLFRRPLTQLGARRVRRAVDAGPRP